MLCSRSTRGIIEWLFLCFEEEVKVMVFDVVILVLVLLVNRCQAFYRIYHKHSSEVCCDYKIRMYNIHLNTFAFR